MSEQWNWQGASCQPVCLLVLYSLLLPPPSVITRSSAHRLTIRWGRGHKHSITNSHHCGILNIPHVRAAGQQEGFCTSEVPQPAGQSASWVWKCYILSRIIRRLARPIGPPSGHSLLPSQWLFCAVSALCSIQYGGQRQKDPKMKEKHLWVSIKA